MMKILFYFLWSAIICVLLTCSVFLAGNAMAGDLQDAKKSVVLRHLGIPYANFVTGDGDGMDVELIQKFAKPLGVNYQYVKTDWIVKKYYPSAFAFFPEFFKKI